MVIFRRISFRPILQCDIVCVPGHLGGYFGISRMPGNLASFIILVLCHGFHFQELFRYHPPIMGCLVHLCMGSNS
jgi:hypothetical protein